MWQNCSASEKIWCVLTAGREWRIDSVLFECIKNSQVRTCGPSLQANYCTTPHHTTTHTKVNIQSKHHYLIIPKLESHFLTFWDKCNIKIRYKLSHQQTPQLLHVGCCGDDNEHTWSIHSSSSTWDRTVPLYSTLLCNSYTQDPTSTVSFWESISAVPLTRHLPAGRLSGHLHLQHSEALHLLSLGRNLVLGSLLSVKIMCEYY